MKDINSIATTPLITMVTAASFLLLASFAQAKTCEVHITGNDALQYNKSEISVTADCDKVELTLEHIGKRPKKQMGHNWTLSKTEDWKVLAQLGQAAGADNNYLPVDDERILANTEMIGGGESTTLTFDLTQLDPQAKYTFFCSFPGHWVAMNGRFNIIGNQ